MWWAAPAVIEEMHLVDRDFFGFVLHQVEASPQTGHHKLRRTEPSPAKSAASVASPVRPAEGAAAAAGPSAAGSGRGGMAWRSEDAELTALATMNLALRFMFIVRPLPLGSSCVWRGECHSSAHGLHAALRVRLCQVYLRTVQTVRTDMAEWRGAFSALYEAAPITVRYLLAVASGDAHPTEALPLFAPDEDCTVISERFLEVFLVRNEHVRTRCPSPTHHSLSLGRHWDPPEALTLAAA